MTNLDCKEIIPWWLLDGLMSNQPMLTHNCAVIHLVFFYFGGCLDSAMAVKGPDPEHKL